MLSLRDHPHDDNTFVTGRVRRRAVSPASLPHRFHRLALFFAQGTPRHRVHALELRISAFLYDDYGGVTLLGESLLKFLCLFLAWKTLGQEVTFGNPSDVEARTFLAQEGNAKARKRRTSPKNNG
jgi:hypothetical protein